MERLRRILGWARTASAAGRFNDARSTNVVKAGLRLMPGVNVYIWFLRVKNRSRCANDTGSIRALFLRKRVLARFARLANVPPRRYFPRDDFPRDDFPRRDKILDRPRIVFLRQASKIKSM